MAAECFRLLASVVPLLFLLLPKNRSGALVVSAALFAGALLFLWKGKKTESKRTPEQAVLVLFLCILMALFFYLRWNSSARFDLYSRVIHLSGKQLCALTAALLCCGSCFSLEYLAQRLPFRLLSSGKGRSSEVVFIFLTAAVTITLASACSPFYPFNDWVDPNTMFTVGKGMLRGAVPYRDLYDQKGPLLHALHALGAVISFDSFYGIWLLETAACFLFLWLQFEVLKEFSGKKALSVIPLLALFTYVAPAFVKGDSAEEFCLPLLSAAVLIGVKSIRKMRFPSFRNCFVIGLTSGCVFWIKYSMLGFYAGWFLFFAFAFPMEDKIKNLFRMLIGIGCGVIAVSFPVIGFFLLNHAGNALLEGYFLNNILYYPSVGTASGPFRLLINLWRGLLRFREAYPFVVVLFAAGLLWMSLHKEKKSFVFLIMTAVSGFFLIFFSGTSFPYYTLIFGIFSGFGLLWPVDLLRSTKEVLPRDLFVPFFLCAGGLLCFSGNMYMLLYSKAAYPQYKIRDVIYNSGIEEPTLLHYGLLDAGFNLTSGLVPEQRFFCQFPLEIPGMRAEQDRYIDEAVTDFVVTCHVPLKETENYELIGSYPGDFTEDGGSSQFYFYQKITNPDS
ncbi:MAG: hypothetical protein IJI14_00205 [Anaerolineaceae bacterium]|nr:hypothetical protein [Anaerolineaceae bacterium]